MAEAVEAPPLAPGVLHTCSIGPRAEAGVLKAGLVAIRDALGSDGLLEFPRRANGTPMLMRQGFFERILKGEVLLNDCSAADASAAEADVKRLSLKQLLAIRCKNLDFLPTAAKKQGGKASFLDLVDRCTTASLTERLLGTEVLPDAHRAQVVRHAVLIYGASRELAGKEDGTARSNWWLLAVGGSRRYLHLPGCEVSSAPPNVPVYCYRSYTAKDPRDPKRERIFRWHAELVEDATKWTEDPCDTEQQPAQKKKLTDGPASDTPKRNAEAPKALVEEDAASPPSGALFSIFGDFDVEDLFDEFDKGQDVGTSSQGTAGENTPAKAQAAPDIDDFFDSLLAETLDDTGPSVRKPEAAGPASDDTSSGQLGPAAEPAAAATASTAEATSAQPATQFAPPSRSPGSGEATSIRDGGGDGSGGGRGPEAVSGTNGTAAATAAPAEPEEEAPPRDAAEARLRDGLQRFYHERKTREKLSNVAKIAQRYSGERVVELWAMLANKYSLPPFSAVQWLANTLPPLLAVQWPKDQAPASGLQALREAAKVGSGSAEPAPELRSELLRAALKTGDLDAISALAFHGCPEPRLRPQLWRALLGFADEGQGSEASGLQQRREAYRELKERAAAGASAAASPENTSGEESAPVGDLAALHAEVEADAKAMSWRGEDFVTGTEVLETIVSIVFTHASKRSYVHGMCEIATLLLYVMADGSPAPAARLAEAEADTFWCFSTLMAEVQDSMATEASTANQAKRVIVQLRTYDAPLAELLAAAGLSAMPTLRLGGALFTKGGFALNDCASLWDSLLADPRRFELSDNVVVAMLLSHRGELLQLNDVGGLAETMLALPRHAKVDALMNYTYAICAFERHCAPGSAIVFPPRLQTSDVLDGGYGVGAQGPTLDNVVQVAQTQLSSLNSWWGKALEAGRSAAQKAAVQAGEMLTEERLQQLKEKAQGTAQAVASAASAARTAAAEKTVAAAAAAATASKEAAAAASAAAAAAAEKIAALDAEEPQEDEEKVMFDAAKEDAAAPPSAEVTTAATESPVPAPAATTAAAAPPTATEASKAAVHTGDASSSEVDDINRQLAELEASMEETTKAAAAGAPPAADDEVPQLVSADDVPKLVQMPPP